MKKWLLLFLVVMFPAFTFAQTKQEKNVKWYDMEEALRLDREQPKKIFIYIYSDNCGWCRRMSGSTLSNPVIASYLNEKFYPVKINAGMRKDITVGTKTYKYVPADRSKGTPAYHEFVVFLLQGRMGWPSVAFLDEHLAYLGVDQGYKKPADFETLLHFVAEEAYLKSNDFEKYAAEFNGEL